MITKCASFKIRIQVDVESRCATIFPAFGLPSLFQNCRQNQVCVFHYVKPIISPETLYIVDQHWCDEDKEELLIRTFVNKKIVDHFNREQFKVCRCYFCCCCFDIWNTCVFSNFSPSSSNQCFGITISTFWSSRPEIKEQESWVTTVCLNPHFLVEGSHFVTECNDPWTPLQIVKKKSF